MQFLLRLNIRDNPVLVDQILRATYAAERRIVNEVIDLNFKSVLIHDTDQVELFHRVLVMELAEMDFTPNRYIDRHLPPLTRQLTECRAVYIVAHGEELTIRGSSYAHAFQAPWLSHRQMAELYSSANADLEHFDETGLAYRPPALELS